jgi:hypothetical protein
MQVDGKPKLCLEISSLVKKTRKSKDKIWIAFDWMITLKFKNSFGPMDNKNRNLAGLINLLIH